MDQTHFYEPGQGHRLAHDPFKAIIAPRPIGWISTVDESGRVNLAPYSFFNGVADSPPILMFSGTAHKDSITNAQTSGEFVFNLVTAQFAETMNTTSALVPHGVDEMRLAGLRSEPSRMVRPPRVAGIASAIECKVVYVHRLHDLAGRDLKQTIIMGQAVGIHIHPDYIKDGIFDTAAARPIARCGYRGDYAEVNALFEMVRPNAEETERLLDTQTA